MQTMLIFFSTEFNGLKSMCQSEEKENETKMKEKVKFMWSKKFMWSNMKAPENYCERDRARYMRTHS